MGIVAVLFTVPIGFLLLVLIGSVIDGVGVDAISFLGPSVMASAIPGVCSLVVLRQKQVDHTTARLALAVVCSFWLTILLLALTVHAIHWGT